MTSEIVCPQCGEPTSLLCEGYCEPCRDANQAELDLHNAEFDAWERLSPKEREEQIRKATR